MGKGVEVRMEQFTDLPASFQPLALRFQLIYSSTKKLSASDFQLLIRITNR
jgi:hypothetical protein